MPPLVKHIFSMLPLMHLTHIFASGRSNTGLGACSRIDLEKSAPVEKTR